MKYVHPTDVTLGFVLHVDKFVSKNYQSANILVLQPATVLSSPEYKKRWGEINRYLLHLLVNFMQKKYSIKH